MTADSSPRYVVERDDLQTECDHPLCDTLHRRFHTPTGDGRSAMHWIDVPTWWVIDAARDERATDTAFERKRDAVAWITEQNDGSAP